MAGYFFGCPHCRAKLEARDASRAGKTVTCPKCEQALIIPPPPKMGVALAQGDEAPVAPADEASQVVVNHDPGFKRPMSPAKAYSEGDALPAPSSSGYDRLPPMGSLDTTEAHTIEAGNDVEGYSFNLPDNDSGEPAPPPIKPKKPKKKSDQPEPPHPFEDPKNQLFALLGVVLFFVALTAWFRSGGDDKDKKKDKPAEVAAPAPVTPGPLPPNPTPPAAMPDGVNSTPPNSSSDVALPGTLPGAPASPTSTPPAPASNTLPGAAEVTIPGNTPPPKTPPPSPSTLPGASEETRPAPVTTPLPESTELPLELEGKEPLP